MITTPSSLDNRAARRARARRTRRTQAVTVLAVATAALASGIALAPSALAEPIQGGVTGDSTQDGVTGGTTQGGTTTPAPTPEPEASEPDVPAEPAYWVAPPTEYQPENVQWRPMPNYDYDTDTYLPHDEVIVDPVPLEQLHLPTPVTPTAPIIAPRNKVRFGDTVFEQPNWVSDRDAERTNNTSAVIEAQVSTFWRSIGVETTRADRLAAAQVAGGATGAVAGATAAGVPAAVTGALVGGTIGGLGGAALGGMVPTPIPGLPVVTTGVAGTAAGAALGAAAAGVPAAAVGAVAGAAAGVAAGTNFGAGDLGQPQEIEVPDIDHDAVATQTQGTLAQWETSGPVGQATATAVQNAVEAAPMVDQQVRDVVATQPGGTQVIDRVDSVLTDFLADVTPGLAGNLLSTAVGDGITTHGN
ncbi:insoluble domain protein [Rhodococcus aetherivorans]|uniref:insoluble domain protein n=1 Tax=Rhodococcus aetherivorans TaxID=191292 RepID=UPI00289D3E44|nr:insoluble domain protein [Rhodococcus aetherivorans]